MLARGFAIICCLNVACAADAGDPLKSPQDASGPDLTSDLDGPGTRANYDSSGPSIPPEPADDSGDEDEASAVVDAAPFDAVVETMVDAACHLPNIPSSCPNCMTQNASDMPTCQKYLACFIQNGCNPSAACGSNDGTCGVNTIGGGEAPYTAAKMTYDCACP